MASKLTAELLLDIGKFKSALKSAQDATKRFGTTSGNSAGNNIAKGMARGIVKGATFVSTAMVLVTTAAAAIAAYKAGKILVNGVKEAAQLETFQMRFEILTGSRGAGNKVLDELRADALRTGIAVESMADNVGKFIAFGFDPDKALKLNKGILDVGGSVGLTTRDMKLLGVALSQVAAKGVANMEELRQQIAEKGIPIFKALEQQLGVTGAELNKMVQEGKVSAETVLDLFTKVPDGEGPFQRFAGGADKMAQTFQGQVNVLKTNWQEFLRLMGEPIRDALMPLLHGSVKMMGGLREQAKGIGSAVADMLSFTIAFIQTLRGMRWDEIGAMLKDALMLGITTAVNFLWAGLSGAAKGLATLLGEGVVSMMKALGILFEMDFWSGLLDIFLGIAMKFGAFILQAISKGVTKINEASGLLGGTRDVFEDAASSANEQADMQFGLAGFKMGPLIEETGREMMADMKTAISNATRDGMETFNNTADLMDTSGYGERMSDFMGEVTKTFEELRKQRQDLTAQKNSMEGAGTPGFGEGGGNLSDGAAINGALSQAINAIAGRSASELIANEAKKQTAVIKQQTKIQEQIEKNTRQKRPANTPRPVGAVSHNFENMQRFS